MSAAITSVLQENRVFPPPRGFVEQANIAGMAQYQALCSKAQADHEGFWADLAKEHLLWHKPFSQTLDQSNKPFYRWFTMASSMSPTTALTSISVRRPNTRRRLFSRQMTGPSPS